MERDSVSDIVLLIIVIWIQIFLDRNAITSKNNYPKDLLWIKDKNK